MKLNDLITSISPFREILEENKSITGLGEALLAFRSEALMRDYSFSKEPVDCLIFAIKNLEQGEEHLADALAWLSQVHTAFVGKENPSRAEKLAEAIRLDLMTQLNGLRLLNVWKSHQETVAQLNSTIKLNHTAEENLTNTKKMLVGLTGYYLGRGLELNEETINAYTNLKSLDPTLGPLLNQRIEALNAYSYLDPAEFKLTQSEFNQLRADKTPILNFINECCLEGKIPNRPWFEEKIKKDAYFFAGISVFAGPLALIVIPTVLLGTPIFKMMDRRNYAKDQKENEVYYAILDEANAWTKAYIKKQAEKLSPESFMNEVDKIKENFSLQKLIYENKNFKDQVKFRRDQMLSNRYYLGDKIDSMNVILDNIETDIKQFYHCSKKIAETICIAEAFSEYLHDKTKQLEAKDGKYHPNQYSRQDYAGTPLQNLPTILRSLEKEFEKNCSEAATLCNDISSRLNTMKQNIKDTIDQVKARNSNLNSAANDHAQSVQKRMF